MKLVFEIHPPSGEGSVQHVVHGDFPLRIGRGFDNGLILSDPYISAHHAEIAYDGREFRLYDIGSENGTYMLGDRHHARKLASGPLRPGDRFRIGHTEIRVYDVHHPVPKALPIQKENAVLAKLSRPLLAWFLFFLSLGATMGWTFFEVWIEEVSYALAVATGCVMTFMLVWAAIWAAAGRMVRHQSHFTAHIALISLFVIFSGLCWYVETYANFLSSDGFFAMLLGYALNFVIMVPLIYASLRLATRMPRQKRRLVSACFAGGLLFGILLFSIVSKKNFEADPAYAATLEPYLATFAPTMDAEQFMKDNAAFAAQDMK